MSTVEKFTKQQIKKIGLNTNIPSIETYIAEFQKIHKENILSCKETFKSAKKEIAPFRSIKTFVANSFFDNNDFYGDILDYFDKDSINDILCDRNLATQFRQHPKVSVDDINLLGWLRKGEIEFEKLNLKEYNEELLKDWITKGNWRANIENVDYLKYLPNIFKEFGAALVYIHFLPKTVYGAVKWINGKPLIMISDREQDLAVCWQTLFHELGHTILHKNEDVIDDKINEQTQISKKEICKKEREANEFVNTYLYHADNLRKYIFGLSRQQTPPQIYASSIAVDLDVNILFVKYWLRQARINPWDYKKIDITFE